MRILIAMTTWAAMTAAKDLAEAGFLVTRAEDGTDLLEYADLSEQNAILFDADLPDMEASACLKQLRRVRPDAAIVLLVPPGARATATRALADGADDVVTYGTDARELAARVQAVARRRAGLSDPVVQFGDLTLDIARQRASVLGRPLHLTRLEYELVESLALRPGRIVTKDEILGQLYALEDAPVSKIIGVYVCHIRQKIAALGGDPGVISNQRGRGYALVETTARRLAA
jgi:DNA-binding response OmpR family regulator